jgi:uncharacterized protein (TIGR03083 family)
MTRLSPTSYLSHIEDESARLREALADAAPTARVPACPDWTAHDLLAHHTSVLEFWSGVVTNRPAAPQDEGEQDLTGSSHDELLERHERASDGLVRALTGLPEGEPAWTWSDDQTVGFILRRQALEALVHRIDAEQTRGRSTDVDALLAADGVLEVLDVMYGGTPPWGTWEPTDGTVRVDVTDTGHQFWVQLGEFNGTHPRTGEELTGEVDFHVVAAPESADTEPDVVVDGTSEVLLGWLWHRADRAGVSMTGDAEVLARMLTVLEHPID